MELALPIPALTLAIQLMDALALVSTNAALATASYFKYQELMALLHKHKHANQAATQQIK